MKVNFFKDGKFIDDCDQANIPRMGDKVIIEYTQYTVVVVTWNYDTREINIVVTGED